MLIVREEHIAHLRKQSNLRFHARLQERGRNDFKERTGNMTSAELAEFVSAALSRACRYGFVLESDLERYVECAFTYGPKFDSDPETHWAGEILRNEQLTPAQRMDRIDSCEILQLGELW